MFKVGDLVSWCGAKGKVVQDYEFKDPKAASLLVEFEVKDARGDRPLTQTFMYDGRMHDWHTEPSLRLHSSLQPNQNLADSRSNF